MLGRRLKAVWFFFPFLLLLTGPEFALSQTGTGFGSVPLGQIGTSQTVTLTFSAAGIAASPQALTLGAPNQDFAISIGGSCTTGHSYQAGDTCTEEVTFTPKAAGLRRGAVVVSDGSGNALASAFVSGVGAGPVAGMRALSMPLLSYSTLGIMADRAIAIDGAGDLFVASLNTTTNRDSVVEVPAGCTLAACMKQLPGTFGGAWGLAVDGAGNLWVGDWDANGRITEIPAAGGYSTEKSFSGSFGNQIGVAVDGSGNVVFESARTGYADSVMELTAASGYTTVETLADNINIPGGIAVDSSGDIFYVDSIVAGVEEIVAVDGTIPATPTIQTVASGLKVPVYLAIDGSDSLYITASSGFIYEVPAAGGYATVNTYSNQFTSPTAIAIDGGGNIFVTDIEAGDPGLGIPSTGTLYEIPRSRAPSFTYTTPTAPGEIDSADGAKQVALENMGNQPLELSALTISNKNFSFDMSTACSASTILGAGDACALGVLFDPIVTGNSITATLTVTDNSQNQSAAQQTITLSGTSLYTPTISSTGLSQPIAVTQDLAMTITVHGASGAPVPTGVVQVTSSSYSGTPTALTNGQAAVTVPAGSLAVGIDTISILYLPDAAGALNYVSVQSQGTITVTSTLMNTPQVQVVPAVQSIAVGQELSVGVSVLGVNGAPSPTGSVVLEAGNYNSGAVALSNARASFTIPANSLTIGTDLIYVTYTPDSASNSIYLSSNGWSFVSVSASAPPAGAAPVAFGSLAIGLASNSTPVTLIFPEGGTPASLIATTQGATGQDFALASGGSCGAGVYVTSGGSCTANVIFTPAYPGLRSGAVAALDVNGQTLAMTYVYGSGTGAQTVLVPIPNSYWGDSIYPITPTSSTQLGDGYMRPNATVDGAGNIYVADWSNNRVMEIPAGCASNNCALTVGSGLYSPSAVSVDGAGNVFVTEAGFNDVKKIPLGCQSSSCMQTIGAGFNQPYGLMVDASGNVFVADTFNGAIKEVVAASGYSVINTLAAGLDDPWSVVVDSSGNLFVAGGGDQCQVWIPGSCSSINTYVEELTAASNYQTVTTLVGANELGKPLGLAIDGSGNVYEGDYGDACSGEILAGLNYQGSQTWCLNNWAYGFAGAEGLGRAANGDIVYGDVISGAVMRVEYHPQISLAFKTATTNGTPDYIDGAQTFYLFNNGNAPLTLSRMTLSDPSFQFDSKNTTCSTSTPVSPGNHCFVAVDFAPVAYGPISATLTLTTNDMNKSGTTTIIPITAVALPPAPVILTTPANPTTATSATITFSDTQSPITFVCSIDSLPFSACSSPAAYPALSGGLHTFQVKAEDMKGNLSPAAIYSWTINSAGPPPPVITSAPASFTNVDTATFAFTDTQAGVTFLCSLDGAAFVSCSSGVSYSGLSLTSQYLIYKMHSFTVEAQDSQSNVSPEATWTWMETTWPISGNPVNFGALPVGQTSAPQAVTFTFTTSDSIATIDATTMGITGLDFAVTDAGTCAVNTQVGNGSTCTLQATFAPKFAGQRKGGVALLNAAGTGIGVAYLEGTGTAPQVTFTPYSTLWYNMLPPQNNANPGLNLGSVLTDAAVDGAGNIYVSEADRGSVDGSVVVNVGAVWELPAGCTTSTCTKLLFAAGPSGQSSSTTSVLTPYGLVMDGIGELWVGNYSLGVSVYPTVGAEDPLCSTWAGGNEFSYARRVGVDGAGLCSFVSTSGQLYLDGTELGVPGQAPLAVASFTGKKETPAAVGGGGYTGTSFDFSTNTTSMTVDPQGNIFVADAGNNAVKEVLASSLYAIERTVGSGFNNPTGVTSDAFGNIYVADAGNNALKEITASSGYTQVLTIATFDPKVLALDNFTFDAAGNIYLANWAQVETNQLAKLDFADAPALSFPTATLLGLTDTTDGTLTATVKNSGNTPLSISGLALSSSSFQIDASATTCAANSTLAVGSSCTIGVIFTPQANGAVTGTLTLTDNSLNVTRATQTFALSGTAFTTPTTSIPTVMATPTSPSITTAQSDVVTVTVTGTVGGPTPTGSVSLSGSSYSSGGVTLSNGVASFTIPPGALALGSNTLNAVYAPDTASINTYGPGTGSTSISVTAVPKSTPTVGVTPSLIDVSTLQNLPVTITVNGGTGNPTPTGSVTLSGGNYASQAVALTNGSTSVTIPAGYLPSGTDTITAFYTPDAAGSANFNSTSGSGQVVVQAAQLVTPLVTVIPSSNSASIAQPLGVTVQVAGGSGNPLPTGSIVLSTGSYNSVAAPISQGAVILTIPAGTLTGGNNTLAAVYTPDNASALTYSTATGSNSVSATAPPTSGEFGDISVGQTSSSLQMTLVFTGSGALGAITPMQQGGVATDFTVDSSGTCTVGMSFTSGSSCVANITFSPQIPGQRWGYITITDSNGNVVASDPVNGTGLGPQARLMPINASGFRPPWPTLGGSGMPSASGLVADSTGNIYTLNTYATLNLVSVARIPANCSSSSCVETLVAPNTTITGGSNGGSVITLDAQGNLFVATVHGGIYEITAASSYQTVIPLPNASALQYAYGIAVDQSGNVFVGLGTPAQSDIYELTAASGYVTMQQVAADLSQVEGMAIDSKGNLFVSGVSISNPNGRQVYESTAASSYTSYTQIGSGLTGQLIIDQADNLFVNTYYTNYVLTELTAASGYTTVWTLGDRDECDALGVDARDGLYCAANTGVIDKMEYDDAYLKYWTPTLVGTTDTADPSFNVTVLNIGNQPLTLSGLTSPAPDFALNGSASTCTSSSSLNPESSCNLAPIFTPAEVGSLSASVTLADNSLNQADATQTLYLTGTGAQNTQTIDFTQPASPVTYSAGLTIALVASGGASGNPVVFTIDASSTGSGSINGSSLTVISAGTIVIDANQAGNSDYSAAPQVQRTVVISQAAQTIDFTQPTSPVTYAPGLAITLSATGGLSGKPVVFSIDASSTGAGSISGSTLTVTGAGTFVIDANQAGNTNYSAASQVQRTVVVSQAAQTINFTQPTSPVTYSSGLTIALVATGGASGNPVVFSIDASSTGTGSISGSTLTVTGAGTFVIDANQAGNTSYSAAPQVQRTVVVNSPVPDFTITMAGSALSVKRGGSSTSTVTATAANGSFDSAVDLSISGLPAGVTGSFSPASITPGGSSASSTLTISASENAALSNGRYWPLATPALAVLVLLPLRRLRKVWARRFLMLVVGCVSLFSLAALSGCGGGFAMGPSQSTYTVTVTGTSGAHIHSTTVRLTVQ